MLQPSDDHTYEVAHLVARLAGEEGPGHPRQKVVRWLEVNDLGAEVAKFNQSYAQGHGGELYKTLIAFHTTLYPTFSASRPLEVIST